MTKSRALIFWLGILFLFSGTMTIWMGWRAYSNAIAVPRQLDVASVQRSDAPSVEAGASTTAPAALDELALTDQRGELFSAKQLRGKVWVASFFFTSCPSVCRMQNAQVAQLQHDYPSDDLHLVSITCDPARDTPEALARYGGLFNADPQRWHFLTGDLDYIRQLGPLLQTTVQEEVHSDRLFVIDRDGKVRGGYRSTDPQQMAQLNKLLSELLATQPG